MNMKNLTFLLFITGLFVLPGCKDYVDEYVAYTINEPVFMTAAEFRLMMIAEDGIYQYDYTDVQQIKQLSRLPIGN